MTGCTGTPQAIGAASWVHQVSAERGRASPDGPCDPPAEWDRPLPFIRRPRRAQAIMAVWHRSGRLGGLPPPKAGPGQGLWPW